MLKRISQEVKLGMGHFAEIYENYDPNPVIDARTFKVGK
jgi:hypothetical protein